MSRLFIAAQFKKFCFIFIGTFFCVMAFSKAYAGNCAESFSWLPTPGENITGYKIYYGTNDGGPYLNSVDVGKPEPVNGRISGRVTGLDCGQTYYFVCVVIANNTVESPYSIQLSVNPGGELPGVPPGVNVFR